MTKITKTPRKNNQALSNNTQTKTRANNDAELCHLWFATKANSTQKNYTSILKSFNKVIGLPLPSVTYDDLIYYRESLINRGLKPNTVSTHLRCVKALLTFGHKLGYLSVDVGLVLKAPQSETIHERLMQSSEVTKILDIIPKHQDKMIISLMYELGLRVSEVGQLKWENFRGNYLSVTGKGNKTRTLLVSNALLSQLKKLYKPNHIFVFQTRNGTGFDRIRIHTMVKKYCQQAGVNPKISSHWFRHFHATNALKHGADVNLVSTSLGHTSIAVTGKYLHANPNDCSSNYINLG